MRRGIFAFIKWFCFRSSVVCRMVAVCKFGAPPSGDESCQPLARTADAGDGPRARLHTTRRRGPDRLEDRPTSDRRRPPAAAARTHRGPPTGHVHTHRPDPHTTHTAGALDASLGVSSDRRPADHSTAPKLSPHTPFAAPTKPPASLRPPASAAPCSSTMRHVGYTSLDD